MASGSTTGNASVGRNSQSWWRMLRAAWAGLEWIGANARVLIALAPVAALFLDDLAKLLRPALPVLVASVYAAAMIRIDVRSAALQAFRPAHLMRSGLIIIAIMMLVPAATLYLAKLVGLGPEAVKALVYTALAPPFASAAAICLILGANAVLALELTILAALVAPLTGPFVGELLLGEALPLDPMALSLRIAGMIAAGVGIALVARKLLTPQWIASRHRAFDGVSALLMMVLIIPLFEGVGAAVSGNPLDSFRVFCLVILANTGVQLLAILALTPFIGVASAATVAITAGNRNGAMYLAALPPNAYFALFVALYQIPMYLTPIILKRVMLWLKPRAD